MNNQTVSAALELAIQLIVQSQRISSLVATAQGEGRTTLKPEEWSAITAEADAARQKLVDAIQA